MSMFTGGPALPLPPSMGKAIKEEMTLRDYFAAKAMAACVSTSGAPFMSPDHHLAQLIAKTSYDLADAMIAEGAK